MKYGNDMERDTVRFRATGFPGTNHGVCWDPIRRLRVHDK